MGGLDDGYERRGAMCRANVSFSEMKGGHNFNKKPAGKKHF